MEFSEIIGRTLASVDVDSERIGFYFDDGSACESIHIHECCESVIVERVDGNINNILNTPIINAYETNENGYGEHYESYTWTQQTIVTSTGKVVFHWLGESNGYYGETPYFQIAHGKLI